MSELDQDQILALISRKFESLRVDYKLSLDLSNDKHKRELVKDVSAQANTTGIDETLVTSGVPGDTGYTIIGADEDGGLYDIAHLRLDDANLQQIVNEHVVPRIRFLFKSIEVTDKNGAPIKIGVIVVPRSENPPHRISKDYKGLKPGQCFVREGTSTREATDRDFEEMYARRLGVTEDEIEIHRLQSYLEAISENERFSRWADPFYIETQGEFLPIYASPFGNASIGEPSRTNLLHVARQHNRMVILGEAGIGKTTALERLTMECASGVGSGNNSSPLPIFVPLFSYNGSLTRSIWASLNSYGELDLRNEEQAISLLRQVKCLLMLDGLNEVPGSWRETVCADISEFMRAFSEQRYIITCRPQDELWRQLHSEQTAVMVIQRLNLGDVRRYLMLHLGKVRGGRLFGAMGEQMRDLARTPLILWFIRNSALAGEEVLSNTRGELIAGFIRTMMRREAGKGARATAIPFDTKYRCLSKLAYSMQRHRILIASGALIREALIESLQEQREDFGWREVLGETRSNGLLVGEHDLHFLHQMFQDFFAASALAKRMDRADWAELACDSWWSDTLVLFCGIAPDASPVIDSISEPNPVLAMECLAESKSVEQATRQRTFAELDSQLQSCDPDLRLEAVRIVRRIGGTDAAHLLLRRLADDSERVRSSARYGLRYIGEDSIPILLSAMPRSESWVQRQIVIVLSRMPPPREPSAITALLPFLVPMLGEIQPSTGKNAAKFIAKLSKHAEENIVELVAPILAGDKMPDAVNAIHVIKRIAGKEATAALAYALNHRKVAIRRRTAQALVYRESVTCTEALIQALDDPDDAVCYYSAIALGKFAGPKALPMLEESLMKVRGRRFKKRTLDQVLRRAIDRIRDRASETGTGRM
jgi:HEAT repeat protein